MAKISKWNSLVKQLLIWTAAIVVVLAFMLWPNVGSFFKTLFADMGSYFTKNIVISIVFILALAADIVWWVFAAKKKHSAWGPVAGIIFLLLSYISLASSGTLADANKQTDVGLYGTLMYYGFYALMLYFGLYFLTSSYLLFAHQHKNEEVPWRELQLHKAATVLALVGVTIYFFLCVVWGANVVSGSLLDGFKVLGNYLVKPAIFNGYVILAWVVLIGYLALFILQFVFARKDKKFNATPWIMLTFFLIFVQRLGTDQALFLSTETLEEAATPLSVMLWIAIIAAAAEVALSLVIFFKKGKAISPEQKEAIAEEEKAFEEEEKLEEAPAEEEKLEEAAPVEEAPVEEEKPEEAPAEEEKPEEAPAEEEKPEEAAPVEEAPAEEETPKEAPAEEEKPEEAPAEEEKLEEAPAEEEKLEEAAPVEEAPAEEEKPEEASAEEEKPEEAPVEEEKPEEAAPVEEAPAEEAKPEEEKPIDNADIESRLSAVEAQLAAKPEETAADRMRALPRKTFTDKVNELVEPLNRYYPEIKEKIEGIEGVTSKIRNTCFDATYNKMPIARIKIQRGAIRLLAAIPEEEIDREKVKVRVSTKRDAKKYPIYAIVKNSVDMQNAKKLLTRISQKFTKIIAEDKIANAEKEKEKAEKASRRAERAAKRAAREAAKKAALEASQAAEQE